MTYWYPLVIYPVIDPLDFTINEIIYQQSQGMGEDNFLCARCRNYEESLTCNKRIFIAFKGANMSGCLDFESGCKCIHCGKIT